MNRVKIASILSILYLCVVASYLAPMAHMQQSSTGPSLMENLGRGVVAVRSTTTEVFISWRVLGTDPPDTAFNLTARPAEERPRFSTPRPSLARPTSLTARRTSLRRTLTLCARSSSAWSKRPARLSHCRPALQSNSTCAFLCRFRPRGDACWRELHYSPNDCSVGDLDGDGEYEIIVKWDPSNAKDNSQSGYTGNVYLDAYKLDGTGCGASTSVATFAPARTTRSFRSMISTETGRPR